jgi:hypothetical protein
MGTFIFRWLSLAEATALSKLPFRQAGQSPLAVPCDSFRLTRKQAASGQAAAPGRSPDEFAVADFGAGRSQTSTGTPGRTGGPAPPEGHPVRDTYLGQPDPVTTGSQNPVGYCDLAEELQFLQRPCGCGCGETSDRDFLPGHDVRAIQQRVRDQYGGSALKLIEFLDAHHAARETAART